MSEYSSLISAIQKNTMIRQSRKMTVIDILNKNGICTMMDLVTNYIPSKGLTANEIRQLSSIKETARNVSHLHNASMNKLYNMLGRYASKHEKSRIFHLLIQNDISSGMLLFSTPDEKLNGIYGIGPKSMEVLHKVKEELVRTRSWTGMSGSPVSQPALMPLTAY